MKANLYPLKSEYKSQLVILLDKALEAAKAYLPDSASDYQSKNLFQEFLNDITETDKGFLVAKFKPEIPDDLRDLIEGTYLEVHNSLAIQQKN